MGSYRDIHEDGNGPNAYDGTTEVHLSGFGAFFETRDNPTETLVRRLREEELGQGVGLERSGGLGYGVTLASAEVVEAAAESIDVYLDKLYGLVQERRSEWDANREESSLSEEGTAGGKRGKRHLCLHLGADLGIDSFLLEYQGRNEASFFRPDERGWQPCRQKIDSLHELSHTLMTCLPVEQIKRTLVKGIFSPQTARSPSQPSGNSTDPNDIIADRHHVGVSIDAGRFVCNWAYYQSLRRTQETHRKGLPPAVAALFVHMPSFDRICVEDQMKFLRALISTAANLTWE